MKNEIRTIGASVRAVQNKNFRLAGTAASYNVLSHNLGGFRERIAPGAFTRSLKSGEDVVCNFNHSADVVLGRTKNDTLRLADTSHGLQFTCQLNPNSQQHRDLYHAVNRGDIDECSFQFTVPDGGDDWDTDTDDNGVRFSRRTLRDVTLRDVSVVTHPAYPSTNVGARSCDYVAGRNAPNVGIAPVLSDRALRAQADEISRQIDKDRMRAITDPSMRAVKLVNGVFWRNYEREAELDWENRTITPAEREFFLAEAEEHTARARNARNLQDAEREYRLADEFRKKAM
ncbi:MAG: HK97 family phage prohead protease [Candidatus Sulfotelmatobacter sp.]